MMGTGRKVVEVSKDGDMRRRRHLSGLCRKLLLPWLCGTREPGDGVVVKVMRGGVQNLSTRGASSLEDFLCPVSGTRATTI
jgi:hypothetical protein